MNDSNRLSCFFLGLGVGVAAGIIFAPKTGQETRDLLMAKADDGKDYLKRRTEELRDSASDLVDKGKDVLNRQREQLSSAVDAGKQAYKEAVSAPTARPAGSVQGI